MRGSEFRDLLSEHFREMGTGNMEIVFRTELGDYVPLDIEFGSNMETIVLLLEEGK